MKIETITDILQKQFTKIQAKFKTVSITHLEELQAEIQKWHHDGLITKNFYKQNYRHFLFHPPQPLQNACSIMIIGIPQKIIPVEFLYKEKKYRTVLPPTYTYTTLRANCKKILSNVLEKKGYSVEQAILPLKLLAVHSGLGKYGKNNLCYVDGIGSFVRLEGFYTDYEFPIDDWSEKQLMDSCTNCSFCQHACPTHCIPQDRILIHADHCLTYLNENKGPFPSWFPTQSHNALVGCLHCQTTCPQNKQYLQFEEHPLRFTEEEISSILKKTPRQDLSPLLQKKLVEYDIDEYYQLLERNLSVLMKK